jgi:hypothetical protein
LSATEARSIAGSSEGEQQFGLPQFVGYVGQVEGLEGHVVEAGGLLVGGLICGTLSGSRCVIDRFGHIATRCALEAVVGQFPEIHLGARTLLEGGGDLAVQPYSPRGAQLAVEGLSEQCMAEFVDARGVAPLAQHMGAEGLVEEIEHQVIVNL